MGRTCIFVLLVVLAAATNAVTPSVSVGLESEERGPSLQLNFGGYPADEEVCSRVRKYQQQARNVYVNDHIVSYQNKTDYLLHPFLIFCFDRSCGSSEFVVR